MAAIKLMTINNVATTYGDDVRVVYAYHMLNEDFIEFYQTYDTNVFFDYAKAYLTEIDPSIASFDGATIGCVIS